MDADLAQEIRDAKKKILEVEEKILQVEEKILKLEGLPEGHQDRAQLLPLRQKEAALQQKEAALQQKKAALQQQEAALQQEKVEKQKPLQMQAAAAVQQPGAAPSDVNSRFTELLKGTYIDRPDEKVLRRIRQDFPNNLFAVKDTEDALHLYTSVKEMPGTSTRRHMGTQHGIFFKRRFGGDMLFSSLVKASDVEGKPRAVKFLKDGLLPPGSSELPEGTEAAAVKAICMRPSKPTGLAIVDAEVVILDLGDGHVSGRKPGRHAVVVMPQYVVSVVDLKLSQAHQAVLAKQGARLEQALEYIHSLGLVHMDIKGANIFVDMDGQWALGDFGAVVRAGSDIKEVTQQFAPVAQLIGKPAKTQYDWHMLAVALAVKLHPDTWKDQLVVSSVDGMFSPLSKLQTAIETATCLALRETFERILARAA